MYFNCVFLHLKAIINTTISNFTQHMGYIFNKTCFESINVAETNVKNSVDGVFIALELELLPLKCSDTVVLGPLISQSTDSSSKSAFVRVRTEN